jgi:hypothetical protein
MQKNCLNTKSIGMVQLMKIKACFSASLTALVLLSASAAWATEPQVFDNPSSVCNALTEQGFPAKITNGQVWIASKNSYNCATGDVKVTAGRALYAVDVYNTISYEASSQKPNRIENIMLTVNVPNVDRADPAMKKFKELATALFKNLNLKVPHGLMEAIDSPRVGGRFAATYRPAYGTVYLNSSRLNSGYVTVLGLLIN